MQIEQKPCSSTHRAKGLAMLSQPPEGFRPLPVSRTLEFMPLTEPLVDACREFNNRLRRAGAEGNFNTSPNRDRGGSPPAPMEIERFVGVDGDGYVRGGYSLRWQLLWLRGERFLGAHYGYPISEGIADKQYAMVGASVLRDALSRCRYLYALGADGHTGNVFRVAQHSGWEIQDVPFLFRVVNGGRFFRKLPQMQSGPTRRLLAKAGHATGFAQLGTEVLHASSAILNRGSSSWRLPAGVSVEKVASLAAPADEVWSRVASQYEFCVTRDAAHVEPAFPLSRTDLHRLVVRHRGVVLGWSVVMSESLSRLRAYLGDVAPGLIVDAFGDVSSAGKIVRAATAYLAAQDVDVVITNASHANWVAAYRRAGFISWHSQFPLLVSRPLASRIGDLRSAMTRAHVARSNGDGVDYLH